MPKSGRSKNAMKHGAFSRELILPGESRKEYQVLLAALEKEWTPQGPTEIELVRRLASLYWRLRRLEVYEQSKMQKGRDAVQLRNEVYPLRRLLQSLGPRLAKATTFKEIEEILVSNEFSVAFIASKVPQPPADQESKWGPAIAKYLEKMEIREPLHGIDEYTEIVDPIKIELEILGSNRLQEEIDRTIKRLVQIKTYKQLLPGAHTAGKLIDVSPTKQIANANKSANAAQLPEEVAKVAKQADPIGIDGNEYS